MPATGIDARFHHLDRVRVRVASENCIMVYHTTPLGYYLDYWALLVENQQYGHSSRQPIYLELRNSDKCSPSPVSSTTIELHFQVNTTAIKVLNDVLIVVC